MYDRGNGRVWSLEQYLQERRKYVEDKLRKASPLVAVRYQNGLLVVTPNPSKIYLKVKEVGNKLIMAAIGDVTERSELQLLIAQQATTLEYFYDFSISLFTSLLAKGMKDSYLGISHERQIPYIVEYLIGGLTDGEVVIYKIGFDGYIEDRYDYMVLGPPDETELDPETGEERIKEGDARKIKAIFKKEYKEGMGLKEALDLSQKAISTVLNEGIGEWEIAVLDRTFPEEEEFHHLSKEELEKLKEVEYAEGKDKKTRRGSR